VSCVLQQWVQNLSFMQQSVLLTAMRGPDGVEKNHVSKLLIRWLRRCVLYSAFESLQNGQPYFFVTPYRTGGGSFTGPSCNDPEKDSGLTWEVLMDRVLERYMESLDAVPHHFQLHFMHAAEIIGYKHPTTTISIWWSHAYYRLVRDMHLEPETKAKMDKRLGDIEKNWRDAEEVTAKNPCPK